MIKIKKTDSIVDIILKMKGEKGEKIILDFPFGHSILHNYTSLKILKTKAWNKELIISTNDLTAKKIWKKLGIRYSITSNEDIIKHNYTFWEYFLYTIKSGFKDASDTLLEKWKNNSVYKYHRFKDNGKIWYFIAFLLISIVLLILVFYFAVNKTYVYIKPEIEIRERSQNFIFKDLQGYDGIEKDNIIKVKSIENTVNIKETFWTSWIKSEKSVSASGSVTLYNFLEEEVSLVKNTRLQSPTGEVFLLQKDVYIVPAIRKDTTIIPGTKTIWVIARFKDAEGKVIGERWNIKKGIKLQVPWLRKNQDKIYAISSSNFRWGSNKYIKVLAKSDINTAKDIIKNKLKKLGIQKVKKEISEQNELNNIQYKLLDIQNAIKYYDFEVTGIEDIQVGDEIENFEIFGTMKTKAYMYNKEVLLDKLKTNIKESIIDGTEELISIDEKSLHIVLELSQRNSPFSLKATLQIDAFISQNFIGWENNYTNRLKNLIAGKNKDEAEKILINMKKISNAKIQIRPFFLNTVSKLTENIEFKIEK